MTFLFFSAVTVSFILFQTSVAPDLWGLGKFFDLIAVFIVYLAIFRPMRESVAFVLVAGAVMDSLSGGPFGLYTTIYCWLFVCIWLTKSYLHVGNVVLVPFIVTAAVFLENTIIIMVLVAVDENFVLAPDTFRNILIQLLWAGSAGPFIIFLLRKLQEKLDEYSFEKIFKYGR